VLCFPDFTENSINVSQIQEEIAPQHARKFLRTVLLYEVFVTTARQTGVSNTQRQECERSAHERMCVVANPTQQLGVRHQIFLFAFWSWSC
jgi:hypothetical protein